MKPIEEALEPVLRDVVATTEVRLTMGDASATDLDGSRAWITSPDGSATMIRIDLTSTMAERIAAVAEQVQEIVVEELAAVRASNWPMCPSHRSTHPLMSAVTPAGPAWTCPINGAEVAAVGDLRL